MPDERYEWEWLKRGKDQPVDPSEEQDPEIQALRRWIEPEPNGGTAPGDTQPSKIASVSSEMPVAVRGTLSPIAAEPAAPPPIPATQISNPLPQPPMPQEDTELESDQSQSRRNRRVPKSDAYRRQLKQEFLNIFDNLNLKAQQRHYLRSRWLDQVLWMEGRANRTRDLYYKLRLTTIVGGVIIPALVSINLNGEANPQFQRALTISTFVVSQAVAISAAVEQFFNYGERWRHYRREVESLKTQGWQFFELTGAYTSFQSHDEAFRTFVAQVESVLQRDVEVFSTQVSLPKKSEQQASPETEQQGDSSPPAAVRTETFEGYPARPEPAVVYASDAVSTSPSPPDPGVESAMAIDGKSPTTYSGDQSMPPPESYSAEQSMSPPESYSGDQSMPPPPESYGMDQAMPPPESSYSGDQSMPPPDSYGMDQAMPPPESSYSGDQSMPPPESYSAEQSMPPPDSYSGDQAMPPPPDSYSGDQSMPPPDSYSLDQAMPPPESTPSVSSNS